MITPPQAQLSKTRAAGIPPMKTELDPFTIGCGLAGVQKSMTRAAGLPPTITVGQHGGMMGIGTGTGTGGAGGGAGMRHA